MYIYIHIYLYIYIHIYMYAYIHVYIFHADFVDGPLTFKYFIYVQQFIEVTPKYFIYAQ